ncbi:hypothetical protein K7X08_016576 [Anisodus acutangulus]|uniref:DNA replication complex GINS protein SLD5 C-terminal domain-containing protein n=1 Tax=Anisodus acutangulus TaxID=402998 RepID=A0A9Q1LFG5_9SOLA|nr:hypothetical protein K7X08_016576 [Anisodus acutangulus]
MKNEVVSSGIRKIQNPTVADYQVLANALKCCASISDRVLGKALHSSVIKLGHHSCQFVIKALLNMYAKCKDLDECQKLFSQIKYNDTVMWNIVLSGFAGSRFHETEMTRLFNSMQREHYIKPSSVTLAIVIPVLTRSGALGAGKSIHCYAVKHGLDCKTLVGNAFISMYAKSGNISDASATFCGISNKDVVSWNAMIAGFIENNLIDTAFELFRLMLKGSILPNYATIANILPICHSLGEIDGYQLGREMHCYVWRRAELLSEVTVINALLSCYLRVGNFEAETLFWNMKSKDLVSWNSIIAGYAANGEWLKTLYFFREFVKEEMSGPDSVTLMSILPACPQLNNMLIGKQIHGYAIRHSFLHQDISVINTLISFYAKCGNIKEARHMFLLTSNKDSISWNTMLDALAENQLHEEFINLLKGMFREGMKADSITLLAVVRYFANISRMDKVKEAHGFSVRSGILLSYTEPTLANALLDAYAKCCDLNYAKRIFESLSGSKNVITCNSMISGFVNYGLHEDAHGIFKRMTERDLTTWNLMVRAYAENDCPDRAMSLFTELHHHKMRPDAMTILSVLPVCAQMALSDLLKQCHAYVIRSFLDDVYLIGALIDVYSKCATLGYAYKLFQSSSVKDLVMFTAMVGGSVQYTVLPSMQVSSHWICFYLTPEYHSPSSSARGRRRFICSSLSCVISGFLCVGKAALEVGFFENVVNSDPEPHLDQYVLCRSKRLLGAFQLDDSEEPLNIEANDLYTLPYKSIVGRSIWHESIGITLFLFLWFNHPVLEILPDESGSTCRKPIVGCLELHAKEEPMTLSNSVMV